MQGLTPPPNAKMSFVLTPTPSYSILDVLYPPSDQSSSSNGNIKPITFNEACYNSPSLPVLSHFNNYTSLAHRSQKNFLLIGYDSEWQNLLNGRSRDMLTWQFSCICCGILHEFIFVKTGDEDLSFETALGCILDNLGFKPVISRSVKIYEYCGEWDKRHDKPVISTSYDFRDAKNFSQYIYVKGVGFCNELITSQPDMAAPAKDRDWQYFNVREDPTKLSKKGRIDICLVCHAGLVDISGFEDDSSLYILKRLKQVQGGLVSLDNIIYRIPSLQNVNNKKVFPVYLRVADTMCHAPAGMKALKNLGDTVGIPKIDIPEEQKEHMLDLLLHDPVLYFEYASRDSVVCLLYASALYGYNHKIPITVTSQAAKAMKESIKYVLGTTEDKDFDRIYRGVEKVSHGNYKRLDRPGYMEAKSLEPISDEVHTTQYYSSQAYHGGYNSCSEVGYFPQITNDYDLKNAYPTAMVLVPDIDWEKPIKSVIKNTYLDITDFIIPNGQIYVLSTFVGYIRFEFPKDCKYPCIPVNVDGIPVYPRTSEGLNGVYVTGPYVTLALQLGAKIFCETGYFLREKMDMIHNKGTISRSLAVAVYQLVIDRAQAKKDFGKGSLEEMILKTMVNSGYGKIAQDVVEKRSWDAFQQIMEDLGCSAITNPFSAAMITSIVQCTLIAAQNEIEALGYMTCSVTTDGFISDCPEDVLKKLELFGFRYWLETSRSFLTNNADTEIWETKHTQEDLINFTTRGNVSLSQHGVCAHNSAKSPYESDSYEDRLWLMKQVLSRTGRIDCRDKEWTTFKDVSQGKTDFHVKTVVRHLSMDFDMKRKPDRNSFQTDNPVIDGEVFEIEHFKTVPFENVEEYRFYRAKKKCCRCLRTKTDWDTFWFKVDNEGLKKQFKDLDRSILMSVIMGYRAGKWNIPGLSNPAMSVKDKVEFINRFNTSSKKFTENDWKNCRKPDRQATMLTDNFLWAKIAEMQSGVPKI